MQEESVKDVRGKREHICPPYACDCTQCLAFSQVQKSEKVLVEGQSIQSSLISLQRSELDINNDRKDSAQFSALYPLLTVQTDKRMQSIGEFCYLIQLLLTPTQQTSSENKNLSSQATNLLIADTIFFQNREPHLLVYSEREDGTNSNLPRLHGVTTRDRLRLVALRRFFQKRRLELEIQKLNQISGNTSGHRNTKQITQQLQRLDINFAHVFYSAISANQNSPSHLQAESSQLLNQAQFVEFMDKKKFESSWDRVARLQNVPGGVKMIRKCRFDYDKVQDKTQFKRAIETMKGIFTPREDERYCRDLLLSANGEEEYLLYIACQLHHLIEQRHSLKLLRTVFHFSVDDFDEYDALGRLKTAKPLLRQYYLFNCSELTIVRIHSIEFSDFFQHYTQNYSKEEQKEFLTEHKIQTAQSQLLLQQNLSDFKSKRKSQVFSLYQLSTRRVPSKRYKRYDEIFTESSDFLRSEYLHKIDDQIERFDNRSDAAASGDIFHQINPQAQKSFTELLKIDPSKQQFLLKERVNFLHNFPLQKRVFLERMRDLQRGNGNNFSEQEIFDVRDAQKKRNQLISMDRSFSAKVVKLKAKNYFVKPGLRNSKARRHFLNQFIKASQDSQFLIDRCSLEESAATATLPDQDFYQQNLQRSLEGGKNQRVMQKIKQITQETTFAPSRQHAFSATTRETLQHSRLMTTQSERESAGQSNAKKYQKSDNNKILGEFSTPFSKQITNTQIKKLMSPKSAMVTYSKLPQFLKSSQQVYKNALPVLLYNFE